MRFIRFLHLALGLALAAPWVVQAQSYPSQPVRMIIPSAPGGLSDPVVRFLSEYFQKTFGQPMVMLHQAGGGGIVGTQNVAKATPDGYTLLLGNIGPLVFAPALNSKLPYSVKELTPVGSLLSFGNAVLVNPSTGITTIPQLIQAARQKPGTINFASAGNGQSQHLTGELFKRAANVDIVHVPYKGTGPAMTDLIGGPGSAHVRQHPGRPTPHPLRRVACHRRHQRQAQRSPAQRTDGAGGRRGRLRGRVVRGGDGAGGHAAAHRAAPERGDAEGLAHARGAAPAGRTQYRPEPQHAARDRHVPGR